MTGLTEKDIKNFNRAERYTIATAIARQAIIAAFGSGKYDVANVIVEPRSYMDDDWYLWTVCAMNMQSDDQTYTVWTLNLTTVSLSGGDYNVAKADITRVMTERRHI